MEAFWPFFVSNYHIWLLLTQFNTHVLHKPDINDKVISEYENVAAYKADRSN